MIDIFSLALSHGLMLIAAWRLMSRDDLDRDGAEPVREKADILGKPVSAEDGAGA